MFINSVKNAAPPQGNVCKTRHIHLMHKMQMFLASVGWQHMEVYGML